MAITSRGYGNDEIGEPEWATMAGNIGAPYTYGSANALRPYAAAGLDRGVALADGVTYGWGVMDTLVQERIQLPTTSSGSASYMIAVRRQWGSGKRVSQLVALLMSGAVPTGRQTTPGSTDDQPIALATVTAGSPVVTNIVDLRAFAAKTYYVPNLNAALDPQLGARYVLPSGDRYVAMLGGAGTVQIVAEKQPDPPVLPAIPRIRWGTAMLSHGNTGWAMLYHNLGYSPDVLTVHVRLPSASNMVQVSAEAWTTMNATITAKMPANTALGWKPYVGTLSAVDWVAYGGGA